MPPGESTLGRSASSIHQDHTGRPAAAGGGNPRTAAATPCSQGSSQSGAGCLSSHHCATVRGGRPIRRASSRSDQPISARRRRIFPRLTDGSPFRRPIPGDTHNMGSFGAMVKRKLSAPREICTNAPPPPIDRVVPHSPAPLNFWYRAVARAFNRSSRPISSRQCSAQSASP